MVTNNTECPVCGGVDIVFGVSPRNLRRGDDGLVYHTECLRRSVKAFHPWTSDEEPKTPKGWGLAAFRGNPLSVFICEGCGDPIVFRDEYLYSYMRTGTILCHNNPECIYLMKERYPVVYKKLEQNSSESQGETPS